MDASSQTYRTVRQHADALALDRFPRAWRKHRDEPLGQLLPAVWLNQFDDDLSHCLFSDPRTAEKRRNALPLPYYTPVRVLLWRCLPKADYWVPDAVKDTHGDDYLWQKMADLSWDDYDQEWRRRIIEQVVIPQSVFKRWKAKYWTEPQEKRGRKKGSGSLEKQDRPLVEEIRNLVANGNASSLWAAAQQVAPRAKGSATEHNKAKRLHRRSTA